MRVQVGQISRPLLRALQFELRQRDVLATLGGLYYWFVADGRKKAIQWLEAAVSMGVYRADRAAAAGGGAGGGHGATEAIECFRGVSIRFLHDPTIARPVRQALIEELGRFQEFQPLLLDIESAVEAAPREPTLRLLRERAGYLEKTVAELATRKSSTAGPRLHELLKSYQQLIASLDDSAGQIGDVERSWCKSLERSSCPIDWRGFAMNTEEPDDEKPAISSPEGKPLSMRSRKRPCRSGGATPGSRIRLHRKASQAGLRELVSQGRFQSG